MKMLSKYAIGSALALALCASYPAAAQDDNPLGLSDDGVQAVEAALIAAFLTGVPEGIEGEDGSILGDGTVELTGHNPGGHSHGGNSFDGENGKDGQWGVTATVHVDTDKDIRSLELVAKLKVAVIFVGNVLEPEGAAQSDVTVSQKNKDNEVDHDMGTSPDGNGSVSGGPELDLDADIAGSVNDNSGVVQLNQDVGNMVNQGNVASVSVATGDSFSTFTDANSAAEQVNEDNTSTTTVVFQEDQTATKRADITDSINGNSGIIHVNQNTGDMNNQLNANSVAISEGAIVALADAALGQFNTGNSTGDVNTFKFDTIAGSVNGNSGIINVNQASGSMNNQATTISFAGRASIGE